MRGGSPIMPDSLGKWVGVLEVGYPDTTPTSSPER